MAEGSRWDRDGYHEVLKQEAREDYYRSLVSPADSIVPRFVSVKPLGEQSTVTVLVASAFCCCFLLLGYVAAAAAYLFLLIWGIFILDNSDSATSSPCEDAYHIWMFCLLNEFVGVAVTACGCQEACRVYQNMSNDSDSNTPLGCPLLSRYVAATMVTLSFFLWGMVEWFSISDGCIQDYNKKYEALLLLFRTGVIADAILLLITVACFVIQRHSNRDTEAPKDAHS
jgi:hypothetical protein